MPSVIDPAVFVIITIGAFVFLVASLVFGGHHGGQGVGHGSGHAAGHGAAHLGHPAGPGNTHVGHGHPGPPRGAGSATSSARSTSKLGGRSGRGNISPFSLQTLLLFIAGVGVGGYFADVFIAGTLIGVLAIASAAGFLLSGGGYSLLNYLYKRQGSSETVAVMDAIGSTGTVLVGIPDGGRGKVSCKVSGKSETFSAESADGKSIPLNSSIKISGVVGSTVIVEPIEPEDEAKLLPWRSTNA